MWKVEFLWVYTGSDHADISVQICVCRTPSLILVVSQNGTSSLGLCGFMWMGLICVCVYKEYGSCRRAN